MKRTLMKFVLAILLSFNTLFCLAKCDDIKVYKLDNGQTVVIKEVHSNPIVVIDTWVKTGSINEQDANNGVSHFLEHLFFKGTTNHKRGEFEKNIDSKGGTFNAATSKDFTHFYVKIASKDFDTALDLHSDMLLNIAIPPEELKTERKVVQEEIGRSKDEPEDTLYENFNSLIFKTHPYKRTVLGPASNIAIIPREKILEYHDIWYKPSNMITVVVGDVDPEKVLAEISSKFIQKGCAQQPAPAYAKEPDLQHPVEKVERGNYNTGYLMLGYKGAEVKNKKDSYALDLASLILGEGDTSRLYQSVKEKKHLATSISAGNFSMRDDGIFYVSANFDPKNYAPLKKAIVEELHKLVESKVTDEELTRAKTTLQRSFVYSNESVASIADSIGYNMVTGGDISFYCNYIDDINKITADDILRVVKTYVKDNRMATSVILPKVEKAEKNIKPVSDVKSTYKGVEKVSLDNGATLLLDKTNYNDIVSLTVFVKGGEFIEPIPGISSMIAETMTKGTKSRTALEISTALENSGIVINPSVSDDDFEITLKSTKGDFNKAFDILEDIITNPTFPSEYVEKTRKDSLDSIKESMDKPSSIVFDEFTSLMYKNHPYGNSRKVYEKTIPKITRAEMVNYYNKVFDTKNMIISVSGNFDRNDVIDKFSSLKSHKNAKVVSMCKLNTGLTQLKENKTIVIPKATETAWLVMGWPAPGIRCDKDFASLKVLSTILGGGMSSRLFVDLRENQGLAYEVRAGYSTKLDKSAFVMYIGTKPENLSHVKDEFSKEIARLINEPISETELENAKNQIIGQYFLSRETNGARAEALGYYETLGKGYKFNFEYPDLVKSISVQDIINVTKKYLDKPYVMSVIGSKDRVDIFNKEVKLESKR